MFDDTQTPGPTWKQALLLGGGLAAAIGGGILLGSAVGLSGADSEWLISLPAIFVGAKALDAVDARPRLRARLRALFGGPGAAVADQAIADADAGIWNTRNPLPETLAYRAAWSQNHGCWHATRAPQSAFVADNVIRAATKEDGTAFVTCRTVGGKLHSAAGQPSAVRMDADGRVHAAAWHDHGRQIDTWRLTDAAPPLTLDIDPAELATVLAGMADEIRDGGGIELFAAKLDQLSDDYWALAQAGCPSVPVSLDDGASTLDALEHHAQRAAADVMRLQPAQAPTMAA